MLLHRQLSTLAQEAIPGSIWRKPAQTNTICLTFDDGPHPEITQKILRILADFSVPATFFLSGKQISKFKDELENIDYNGHLIGNHGYSHRSLMLLNKKTIEREIRSTDYLMEKYLGLGSHFFRPPYGIFGPGLLDAIRSLKKKIVMWSLMSNDFKWDAQRVLSHLKKNVRPGDIVVFHDSQQNAGATVKVLPEFLEICFAEKYRFAHL